MKDNEKTLVVRCDWWLWRIIAMAWPITAIARERPVKVITSRPLVFWGNTAIKSVHWLDDRRLYEDVIKGNDYIELEPYTDPAFFNDAENWLKVASKQLWLSNTYEPLLVLAEHEKLCNVLEWNPVLFQPFWSTMQANGSDKSYRSIRVQDAQYIADRLIERWFTVYVVERPDQPKLRWCVCLDTPDLRFVLSLCARYPVLWADSCLHHAAKAFGKTAVVVWAGTDAERFWYDSNINLREHQLVAFTPMRLPMNDFNFDISNQYTNQFSKEFLDKVVTTFLKANQVL